MKKNQITFSFWGLVLWMVSSFSGFGQESLNTITVSAPRLRHSLLSEDLRVDSLAIVEAASVSLTDVLHFESSVYVRSFGPGLASTISKQGFSPAQSVVYWNGIPLNSPSLGLTDASMIPTDGHLYADGGAGSGLYGSGYMGGGFHLQTAEIIDSGLQIRQQNQYFTSGLLTNNSSIAYRTKRFQNEISFSRQWATYDYEYTDLYGEERTRLGADQDVAHLRYEGKWLSKGSVLAWGMWGTNMDRGIPRSISEAYTEGARQEDQVIRAYTSFTKYWSRWTFHTQLGLYNESQIYLSQNIQDTNLAGAVYVQGDVTYQATENWRLYLSGDISSQGASGTSKDTGRIDRVGGALTTDYVFDDNWSTSASIRAERQGDVVPVLPSLTLRYSSGGISSQISYRQHFRFPTLNDLFWNPGGNPDLLPELGRTTEMNIEYQLPIDRIGIRLFASGFAAEIDNYIIWVPSGTYHSPMNIKEVSTMGGTAGFEVKYGINTHLDFNLNASYSQTHATTRKSDRVDDPSVGNQLIYTPKHKATMRFGLNYHKIEIWSRGAFNGRVHTTTDNQDLMSIDPFMVWDMGLGYSFDLKKLRIQANMGVLNFLDAEYSYQRFYPLPGIQGTFSLIFQFKTHED